MDSDLQTLAVIDDSGQVKTRFRQGGDRIFPLVVGKTYTREYDNPVNRYRGNYKYTVTGVEEVRTEAGTFTAFRISEEGRGTYYNGAPFSERGVLYIAPSAKFRVKYSFEVDSGYKYSEELVSYQVVRD